MAKHIMIDLETLNVRTDTVILTLGAVLFDPYSEGIMDSIYIKPDVDEQLALGRSVDEGTIQWWGRQSKSAQDEAFSPDNRVPFVDFLQVVQKFCWPCDRVWSNGAAFDVAIIEQALLEHKIHVPWKHYEVRDTRTIWEVAGVKLSDGGNITSHRADDDAIKQALLVQRAYKIINQQGLLHKK